MRNAARPQRFESGIYLIGTSPAIRMLSTRASAREAPRLATGKNRLVSQLVRAGWLAEPVRNDRLCVCVSVCVCGVCGVCDEACL